MSRGKRKRFRKIFVLLFMAVIFLTGKKAGEGFAAKVSEIREILFWQQPQEWNLILVNWKHQVPKDYKVTLVEAEEGKYVDERIYDALLLMFESARAEGIYPVIRDAYRSMDEQQEIMDDKVSAYENEGYPKFLAKRFAKDWVAEPGTSEHQLGIAVDINADKSLCTNEAVYEWLAQNAHQYGFILRYPKEKEEITKTAYEPWHYRYVGIEAAQEIFEQKICLEEYLQAE